MQERRLAAIMPACNCQALRPQSRPVRRSFSEGGPARRNKSEGGFTDIVGYSALLGSEEDLAIMAMRKSRESCFKLH